jgi:hypothetical protein
VNSAIVQDIVDIRGITPVRNVTPFRHVSACPAGPRVSDLSPSSASSWRISSCIVLFYISATPCRDTLQPDALYADRENLASAQKCRGDLGGSADDGHAFEAAWKLSRACYWLGGHAPEKERKPFSSRGFAQDRRPLISSRRSPKDISGWRRTWGRSRRRPDETG